MNLKTATQRIFHRMTRSFLQFFALIWRGISETFVFIRRSMNLMGLWRSPRTTAPRTAPRAQKLGWRGQWRYWQARWRALRTQKRRLYRTPKERLKRLVVLSFTTFVFTVQFTGLDLLFHIKPAFAATTIAIEPITWDFVGLDSNKPETQGPNTYVVGARVCNLGTEDALNVKVKFVKDGVDNGFAFIQLQAGDTYTFDRIPADDGTTTPIRATSYVFDTRANGSQPKSKYLLSATPQYCQDFYYNFEVTRTPAAWNTYQKYYIEASGSNTNYVATERPRQNYIEKLISQARNEVFYFGCDPAGGSTYTTGAVTVQVGDTFTCETRAHTATAYPQMSFTADIPNVIFQVLKVNSTYSNPPAGINSTVYADGCGWVNDPTDPRYHLSPSACSSETGFPNTYSDQYPYTAPPTEGKGAVGNDIVTRYTIKVLAFPVGIPNPIRVSNIILDYSGSSYHYNADYRTAPNLIDITVANPNPTDLSVTKTHTGNFSYGDNTYTLTVADNANGTAAKSPVTLTDTLPAGYTFKDMNLTKVGIQPLSGANAANWNCDASGQVMTCLYDTNGDSIGENFPDGGINTLTLNVNIASGAVPSGTTSTNFAKVSLNSAQADSNTANNTASDPTTLLSGADAAIAKTHSPATFLVGNTGTYTLTLNNIGDLDAAGPIVVTDTLPNGLVFNGLTAATLNGANNLANWSCSNSGQIVTCQNSTNSIDGKDADGANGTAGDTFVLTLGVSVTSAVATPSVTNTATVSIQTLDISPGNNTATDPTPTAVPAPDLTISKTDFGAVIADTGTVRYTIQVSNVGTNATTGVITVVDKIDRDYTVSIDNTTPANSTIKAPGLQTYIAANNLIFNSYVNAGWTCSYSTTQNAADTVPDDTTLYQGELTCRNYAPLPAGGTTSYEIELKDATGTPTNGNNLPFNAVTVVTAGETNTSNNTASDDTPIGASGNDISVKKCFESEISDNEPKRAGNNTTANILCGLSSPESFSYSTTGSPSFVAGDTVRYSMIVGSEDSSGNTEGAYFEDQLPPELEFPTGNTSFGWRCDALDTGSNAGNTYCDGANSTANFPNTATPTFPYSNGTLTQTLTNGKIVLPRITLKKLGGGSGGNPALPGRVRITVVARVKTGFDGNLSNTANVSAIDASGNRLTDSNLTNNVSTRAVETPKPDLSVSKTHTGNFDRDVESTYTITVTNKATAAGATVEPIIVTDYLPVNGANKAFEYVSASGTGWSCNYDSGTHEVACTTLASLAVGATSNPITVRVKPLQSGSFSNEVVAFTANESLFTTDGARTGGTNTDNDDFDPTTVNAPNVNLVLDKSDINPPFGLSNEETYRITVANTGTTQAIAPITITDQLPPGIQFLYAQTINGSPWVCSSTTDALPDNNANGIFDAGDGNGTADGFETVTCTRYTNIAPSEAPVPTVDLKVLVTANTATGTNSITNQARVTSTSDACTSFSCAATDNRDTTVQTTVNPLSDLAVVKTAVDQNTTLANNQFYQDGTAVYNITVTNNGPSAYSGTVTINENLGAITPSDPNFTYASHSSSATWTCTSGGGACVGNKNLVFSKTGGLLAGESSTITLTVNVPDALTGTFTNTATIDATTITAANDTNTTNNSDPETVDVLDNTTTLTLIKDDNDGESPDEPTNADLQAKFVKGGVGKYTIVARNSGPSPAKAPVTISDTLPTGLTYAGNSQTANWNCTGTLGSQNFSCIYGIWTDTNSDGDRFDPGGSAFTQQDLPVGTSSGVEIRVNVLNSATTSPLSGSVYTSLTTNSASVSGSNFTTVNASEQTAIVDPADLAVTKSVTPDPLTAGSTGTYAITVTNNGPGTSYPQIYLQDYLPTGLTYNGALSGTAGGDGTWTIVGYNDTANEVTYRRGTALANGASTTISLPVTVSATAPGSVTNFIRVGGFTPEPDYDTVTPGYQDPTLATCDASFGANQPVNNCYAVTTAVQGGVSTDLRMTKIHGGIDNDDPPTPAVNFNTNYSYTLQVANLSAVNAETVTVTDVLPTWLEYVSYSIDAGDLTIPNPYGSTPANLNRICGYATGTRTFSCNLLRVSTAENATDPVDITLTVRSLVSGVVNNTATVASVTADTITANNTESEGVLINAGGTNTISGRVFNDLDNGGPTDQDAGETGTQNVKVNLYLDNGGVLGTYDPGDTLVATTTTNASGDYSFTTNLTGNFMLTVDTTTLPAGHQLTPTGSAVTSQSAVLPNTPSNDINNNFGHRSLTLPTVDIGITKTDSIDPINAGASFSYTLTVSSDPTNSANNVVVTDTIPASLTINSVTPSSPTCTVAEQVVTCNLGTIAAGSADQVITINVTSTVSGTITNTATVTTDNPESNAANNTDSEQTVVNASVAGNTTCYVVADTGNRLITLDINALTVAAAPGVLGAPDVEAIAYNPFTGILYGADADRFGTINTTTGAFTFVGSFGSSSNGSAGLITFDDIDGLAFNPYTGELFGAQREEEPGKSDILIKINPATGAFIPNAFGAGVDYLVINTGATYANIDDITIDPFDGTLYAIANEDNFTATSFDQFVKVNLTDGSTTTVGSFGVGDVEGLTVFNNGNIYLTTGDQPADGIDDSFYTVNKTSGAGTKLIDLGSLGADYEGVSCLTGAPNFISGTVFLDDGNGGGTVNDGILNGTEAGTNGVTVRLYRDVDLSGTVNAGDVLLTTQVTTGGGNYSFGVAATGAFVLDIDTSTLPAGQALTSDNVEVANFGTSLGVTDANNNFGHNASASADLLLVKRITAVRRNGVDLGVGDRPGGQDIEIFNDFGTATDEDNAANWPADDNVYLRGAINGGEIRTGDEVEYTIYFLNDGAINAQNVTLCDVIPDNMTYVPSSMSLFLDNTAPLDSPTSPNAGTYLTALTSPNSLSDSVGDGDLGAYYAPGILPQPNNLCRRGATNITTAAENTTGAVVIKVVDNTTTPNNIAASTAPGTPSNSYGFIRFRAVTK